jgi:hypothetical protein
MIFYKASSVFGPSGNGFAGRSWSLCAADVCRALLALFLILSHSAFLFFYVFLGDEPHPLALLSLVSVALYLHILIFMLVVLIFRMIAKLIFKGFGRPGLVRLWIAFAFLADLRILNAMCKTYCRLRLQFSLLSWECSQRL